MFSFEHAGACNEIRAAKTGGCSSPVEVTRGDMQMYLPCRSRIASKCPACARRARQREYQRVLGGVRAMHRNDVLFWITLTPPGARLFGCPVHRRTHDEHGRRTAACPCGRRHDHSDGRVGVPLNPDRFEYARAAAWNEQIAALWAQSVHDMRRWLRIPRSRYTELAYLRVVEYQQRGLLHVHALVRVRRQPGRRITEEGLKKQLARTRLETVVEGQVVTLRWGEQSHVEKLTGEIDEVTMKRASYVAKYATKSPDDALLDSARRTRHYARIAIAAQERMSNQLSMRALGQARQRLGRRGSLVSASHSWEPKWIGHAAPPTANRETWRHSGTGYDGAPPPSVELPASAFVPFEWRCARAGVELPSLYDDANDGVEAMGWREAP